MHWVCQVVLKSSSFPGQGWGSFPGWLSKKWAQNLVLSFLIPNTTAPPPPRRLSTCAVTTAPEGLSSSACSALGTRPLGVGFLLHAF